MTDRNDKEKFTKTSPDNDNDTYKGTRWHLEKLEMSRAYLFVEYNLYKRQDCLHLCCLETVRTNDTVRYGYI